MAMESVEVSELHKIIPVINIHIGYTIENGLIFINPSRGPKEGAI